MECRRRAPLSGADARLRPTSPSWRDHADTDPARQRRSARWCLLGREAVRREPALDHPSACSIEVGNGVRDATEPAVVFAAPLEQQSGPSTGVSWGVDDPAVAGVVTAPRRGHAHPFGQRRAIASGHAAGHRMSIPQDSNNCSILSSSTRTAFRPIQATGRSTTHAETFKITRISPEWILKAERP